MVVTLTACPPMPERGQGSMYRYVNVGVDVDVYILLYVDEKEILLKSKEIHTFLLS